MRSSTRAGPSQHAVLTALWWRVEGLGVKAISHTTAMHSHKAPCLGSCCMAGFQRRKAAAAKGRRQCVWHALTPRHDVITECMWGEAGPRDVACP